MKSTRKQHWEQIYQTKEPHLVSWTQETPQTSLDLIGACKLPKNAKIIDVGGGNSLLADRLLDLGYQNISVLDVSEAALERAKKRIGERHKTINWIVSDIVNFRPDEKYDCWHDRATFHFLTDKSEIATYREIANHSIVPNGNLIIGTFSETGPEKCSGIAIKQYSESSLSDFFENDFKKQECLQTVHQTPFDTLQNFVFCRFKKS